MLSKSRGHVLRVATVLHLLFNLDDPYQPLDSVVSEAAVKAAVNFIQVASQQTASIAGRGTMSAELDKFKAGKVLFMYFALSCQHAIFNSQQYIHVCMFYRYTLLHSPLP